MAYERVTFWSLLKHFWQAIPWPRRKDTEVPIRVYDVLELWMTKVLCCPWDLSDLAAGGVLFDYIPKIYGGLGSWRAVYTCVMALNTMRWCTGNQ